MAKKPYYEVMLWSTEEQAAVLNKKVFNKELKLSAGGLGEYYFMTYDKTEALKMADDAHKLLPKIGITVNEIVPGEKTHAVESSEFIRVYN